MLGNLIGLLAVGWLSLDGAPAGGVGGPGETEIKGRVVTTLGAGVEGAVVAIPSLQRQVVTGADGTFRLTNLPEAELTVQVRAIGFRPATRVIQVSAKGESDLQFVLEPSVLALATVVVTGTPAGSSELSPLDVAAVEPEQMRATATASLGKTLERVPGVSNMSQGPAAGNPMLRGLSQGHIRILRDGVPQENFQASPRWFPPGNLSGVERIEVVRGPAGVLYGPNAVGGAVNLIPRPLPQRVGGEPRFGGVAELHHFANNDEQYGHLEVNGAPTKGIGFRMGASRRLAGDFRVPTVATFAESGAPRAPIFSGRLPHTNFEQSGAYGQFGVSGGWGQAYAGYDWWEGANNFLNANGTPTAVAMTNHDLRLRGSVYAGAFAIRPVVLYQRVGILRNTQATRYELAEQTDDWNQEMRNDAVTGRLEVQHPAVRGLRGTFGIELNHQAVAVPRSTIEPASTTTNAAIFAFEEYQFGSVNVSAGVRADRRNLSAASNAIVDRLDPAERPAALDRQFLAVTGSVGVGIRLSGPLMLALNASSGFRPPTSLDLYTDEFRPALGSFVEGNPLLRKERSRSVEASLRYQANRVAGSIIGYRNGLSDYVYLVRTDRTRLRGGKPQPVYVNTQSDGWIRGLEVAGAAEVLPRLVVDASYAMLRSRNLTTGEELPLKPADNLRLSGRYTGSAGSTRLQSPYVEVSGRYVWEKEIAGLTEPFAEAERNPMGPGVGSTTAYTLVNFAAGARLRVAGGAMDVHLSVDNLFDVAYRDFLDTLKGIALGQGRSVGIRLALPFVF